jgi:hypothetical protein
MKSNHENLNSFIFNFIELCSAFFLDAKKAFKKNKNSDKGADEGQYAKNYYKPGSLGKIS